MSQATERLKTRARTRRRDREERPDPLVDVGVYIGWFARRWSKHKRLTYRKAAVHFVRCLEAAGQLALLVDVEHHLRLCFDFGRLGYSFPALVTEWIADVLQPVEAARPRRAIGDYSIPQTFATIAARQFDLGRAQFARRAVPELVWVRCLLDRIMQRTVDTAELERLARAFLDRYDRRDFKPALPKL